MNWRAPWLKHRSLMLLLGAWDVLVIGVAYEFLHQFRLSNPSSYSTYFCIGLILGWLVLSYLFGRYSAQNGSSASWVKTAAATAFLLSASILEAWITGSLSESFTFRGFLIPLFLIIFFFCWAGSSIAYQLLSRKRNSLVICSQLERIILEKEIRDSSIPRSHDIQFHTEDNHCINFSSGAAFDKKKNLGVSLGEFASLSNEDIEGILLMRPKGARLGSVIDWAENNLQRVPPELLSEKWLLSAEGFSLQPGRFGWRLKRLIDFAGASILLLLTSPLILAAALMIFLEDRGPVFYSQIRTGLFGRPIRIWKLRSMYVNSESNGAQWAKKGDSRITRSGRLLRALRIDELPQLLGVISGDLSLIGPRPERPEIEHELEAKIPHYRVRHWIRPGLSGWAQVNYPYGNNISDSRMKLSYDLYYLRNAGILLDLLITIKTIRLILGAKGASPQQ